MSKASGRGVPDHEMVNEVDGLTDILYEPVRCSIGGRRFVVEKRTVPSRAPIV